MKKSYLLATYMNPFFNQYLAVLKNLSVHTILAYRDAIKLLVCFIAEQCNLAVDTLTVEHFTEKRIVEFLTYIEQKRKCSISTRNARLAAIRSFFEFISRQEPALMHQCHTIRTIPQKKKVHKCIDYLDESELKALIQSLPSERSITALRDKALLLMLYNTGARVSEIVELTTTDLRLDNAGQVKLLGKGRKQRSCPLWPETVNALQLYLNHRGIKNITHDRLFLNANGLPITRFGIRYIVKKYAHCAQSRCRSIALKNVTPHTFRHTTAMHLIRSGNDITMVSFWLGHASVETTHAYVEIDMDMKRKMLKGCAPSYVKKSEKPKWQQSRILLWLNTLSKGAQLCEANY